MASLSAHPFHFKLKAVDSAYILSHYMLPETVTLHLVSTQKWHPDFLPFFFFSSGVSSLGTSLVDTVELPTIHETYGEKTDVQHGTHFIISTQQFCLMTTSVSTAACGVWTLLAQPSRVASMPSNTQFLHFLLHFHTCCRDKHEFHNETMW